MGWHFAQSGQIRLVSVGEKILKKHQRRYVPTGTLQCPSCRCIRTISLASVRGNAARTSSVLWFRFIQKLNLFTQLSERCVPQADTLRYGFYLFKTEPSSGPSALFRTSYLITFAAGAQIFIFFWILNYNVRQPDSWKRWHFKNDLLMVLLRPNKIHS